VARPTLLLATATMCVLPPTQSPLCGVVIVTVGALPPPPIVTVTAADVVALAAASLATAVSEWLPAMAVPLPHVSVYGAVVTGAPRFAPFSLNCTLATPTLSLAVAVTVVVPLTVEPVAGAVIATAGGVVSLTVFDVVTVTGAEVAVLPAASLATAV